MSAAMIRAPRCASNQAIAWPIPAPPAVTNATLPSSCPIAAHLVEEVCQRPVIACALLEESRMAGIPDGNQPCLQRGGGRLHQPGRRQGIMLTDDAKGRYPESRIIARCTVAH